MTKNQKYLLGALTFAPFIFIGLYLILFFGMFTSLYGIEETGEPPTAFFGFFGFAFVLILLTILTSIATLIYYIIHVINNPKFKLPENSSLQIVWILVILLANGLGSIAYFFVEVWPEQKLEGAKL